MGILDFLTHLFENGRSYSTINTARSALSTVLFVDGKPVGTHPLVIRLFKGIYNQRPTVPRYSETWDVNIVFKVLRQMSPVKDLSLKDLTLKLVMLMSLVTGHRGQSFFLLDLTCMHVGKSSYTFTFQVPLKNCTARGTVKPILRLRPYAPDRRLCVVTVLKEYLTRTAPLRGEVSRVLVSYQKPHLAVSRDTVSRWVRIIMARAGINVTKYAPHSCRAATVAAARTAHLSVSDIMSQVGWASERVFAKYYDKPLDTSGSGGLALSNVHELV